MGGTAMGEGRQQQWKIVRARFKRNQHQQLETAGKSAGKEGAFAPLLVSKGSQLAYQELRAPSPLPGESSLFTPLLPNPAKADFTQRRN